jgi:hypothetical protein
MFQIIADALAAATVVQLAFTLFTPGPDEALDPVLLAIASALLLQLGNVTQFHWADGLAVLLYGTALGGLFVVRVFIAPDPDPDKSPRLWWWPQRHPSTQPQVTQAADDPAALVDKADKEARGRGPALLRRRRGRRTAE